jgi:heme/copper-type cytochrome/quinol oxidase subunit 1
MQLYKWLSGASFAVTTFDFEVNPTYKSTGFGLNRMVWVIRNWEYIVGILIVVVIIAFLIHWMRGK